MPPQLYFDDVNEGAELPTLEKTPATRQLVMYAGASGDFYEIHYDQEIARASGLPNVIVHGALKNAFLAQLLTDWIGVHGTLKKLAVRYRDVDVVGSRLHCKGQVRRKFSENGDHLVECDLWIENDKGDKTTTGLAVVALPSRVS